MQWVTTDQNNLITQTLSANDFLSFLCEKLDSVMAHSFIAKKPVKIFKEVKGRAFTK